jgi:hypothetical protein
LTSVRGPLTQVKEMFSTFAGIAAMAAGLAIAVALLTFTPRKGLKGLIVAIAIAVAAAFLLTMARGFAP